MKSSLFVSGTILSVSTFLLVATTSCNNDSNADASDKDTTTVVSDTMNHSNMTPATMPLVNHAEATLTGTTPDTVLTGTAKFDADSSGVVTLVIEVTAEKMAGKSVAVHLHEHGDCGDMGKMAHGHWNPTNAQHGKWGSSSFHLGDIGNIKLDGKGKGTISIKTDLWSLGGEAAKNVVGKAVIVHGGVDDFTTQPTGNAGSRIGCGVIQ